MYRSKKSEPRIGVAVDTSPGNYSRRRFVTGMMGLGASLGLLSANTTAAARARSGRSVVAPKLAQDASQSGGELVYALTNPPDTLDPSVTTFTDVLRMANHLFDPILRQPTAGEFVPSLAEAWEVNDDATEYTFIFQTDVMFHDETPFDAEAVKFTFDRIIDPETRSQSAFSLIGPYESSEATDESTLVVRFHTPYAPFFDSVAQPALSPLSPTAVGELGLDFGNNPVGTGPFVFDSYQTGSQIRMVRNDNYTWGSPMFSNQGPAHLDSMVWRIIPEPATRVAALQTGEVHFIQDVPTQDFESVQGDSSLGVLEGVMSGSGESMMINVTREPMDDVRVRQALQWGVDKEGMSIALWQGVYQPSHSPLTSATFGFDPSTADMYQYDPERAEALLDEAGWVQGSGDFRERDGETLTIGCYYRSDNSGMVSMATFLQANYAEIGIDFELHPLAQGGYFDAVRTGQHHIQFWWGPATDPDGVFRPFFHSSNADGGTNRNRYVNPEVDELIDEAAGATDPEVRSEIYSTLQHRVLDEAIMVFFAEPMNIYAFQNDGVTGAMIDWSSIYPLFHDASLG